MYCTLFPEEYTSRFLWWAQCTKSAQRTLGQDTSGRLEYEELAKVVRKPYPGLKISESMLSDEELRGVWKAMDAEKSGHVSIQDFVLFQTKLGPRGNS
eukprot:s414_g1.t1